MTSSLNSLDFSKESNCRSFSDLKTLSADGSQPQKMKVSQTMASFSEASVNQAFLEYAISESDI